MRIDILPLVLSLVTTPHFRRRLCVLPSPEIQAPTVASRSACFRIIWMDPGHAGRE